MKHVRERFRVHQSMLHGNVKELTVAAFGLCCVQAFAYRIAIREHSVKRGPITRAIARQTSTHRIDAEREQPVELCVERLQTERSGEQIPVERLEVPDVEDDAVPLGNGRSYNASLFTKANTPSVCRRAS
jgi:hypothetical protein